MAENINGVSLTELEIIPIGMTINGFLSLLTDKDKKKALTISIGPIEGTALMRAIHRQETPRPTTHDLMGMVLDGFNITIKRAVIIDVVDKAYIGLLILEQSVIDTDAKSNGERNEVRLDCRPSDMMVLAVKTGVPVYATPNVMALARDFQEFSGLAGREPCPECGGFHPTISLQILGLAPAEEPEEGLEQDETSEDEEERREI